MEISPLIVIPPSERNPRAKIITLNHSYKEKGREEGREQVSEQMLYTVTTTAPVPLTQIHHNPRGAL